MLDLDIILLSIFTIYIAFTTIYIIRRNILFGGVHFFMFIYSIFAQIGYAFFPELSTLLNAYYGKQYFYKFYYFNFLSFIVFFLLFYWLWPYFARIKKYEMYKSKSVFNAILFLSIIGFIFIYQSLFFVANYNNINYLNAADDEFKSSQGPLYTVFLLLFKLLSPIVLMMYVQRRIKIFEPRFSNLNKRLLSIILICFSILFVVLAQKLGSRTDLLACAIGILIFEIKLGLSFKKIIKIFGFVVVIGAFLIYIEQTRSEVAEKDELLAEKILFKDYFPPAHILYASMGNNIVQPGVVISSNVANSLVLLKYPYLQATVMDVFMPGLATRSASYAFYLFTEGFLVMGYYGFLYNGFILIFGLLIWYLIGNSKNKYYSYLVLALMSAHFANICRGQSSYFIKDIYIFFIPALVLLYLSSGLRPRFKIS